MYKPIDILIEESIIEHVKETFEERTEIHVADLTTCLTKSYFTKKYGLKFSRNTAYWVLFGDYIHNIILPRLAKKLNGKYEVETIYEHDNVQIGAKADIITDKEIYELKSCRYLPKEPYEHHIEQINFYLYVFERNLGNIIYIRRDNSDVRVFRVYPSIELFFKTLAKAKILKRAIDQDKPPKPCIKDDFRKFLCRDCQYNLRCPYYFI